jgi:hypothetical protein
MAEAVKRLQLNWSSIQTELKTVHYQNLDNLQEADEEGKFYPKLPIMKGANRRYSLQWKAWM